MLPTARACPVCGQAWLQSIWGGARCYPPYDATPQEGQEDETGHHSPQGDEASEASEDHLAQFAAIFPDYDQVFQEGQEESNQEGHEDSNQEGQTPTRRTRRTPISRRPQADEKDVLGHLFLCFSFYIGVGPV